MHVCIKKTLFVVGLCAVITTGFAKAPFTITPSTSAETMSSNGTTSVEYTVTSNWPTQLTNLVVDAGYNNPNVNGLTLSDDECTGTSIAPNNHCQFRVIIPGTFESIIQPTKFQLTPSVTGSYNGYPVGAYAHTSPVTVNVVTPTVPTRAYEVTSVDGVETLNGIDTSTGNVLTCAFNTTMSHHNVTGPALTIPNNVVVSNDGTTIYAAYTAPLGDSSVNTPPTTQPMIYVFKATTTTLTHTATIDVGSAVSDPYIKLALTPDNKTLFASVYAGTGPMLKKDRVNSPATNAYIYSINTGTDAVTQLSDPDDVVNGNGPGEMVISPDGSTVYMGLGMIEPTTPHTVGTAPLGSVIAFPVTATSISSSDVITSSLPVKPTGMAFDPAGNVLYVADTDDSGTPVLRFITTPDNTLEDTFYFFSDTTIPEGLAVSPDGDTVYAALYGTGSNEIAAFNTQTDAITTFSTVTTPYGLALTPDGSSLYVTQGTTAGTSVCNTTAGVCVPTGVREASNTLGDFVGP